MATSTGAETKAQGQLHSYDKLRSLFAARTAERCCSYFLSDIKPTDHILDVGCGPGSISLGLAKLVPDGRVTGIDISAESISQAKESAESKGVTNITFIEGDAHQLLDRFKEASFDIVHAHMVVMHLSQPVEVIKDMRRLAKPGGHVAIKDNAQAIRYPDLPAMQRQFQIYESVHEQQGLHPSAGKYNQLWAHEAGFAWDKIRFGSDSWEASGDEGREPISQVLKNSGRDLFLQSGATTVEELDEIARAWEEWATLKEARWITLDGWVLCQK